MLLYEMLKVLLQVLFDFFARWLSGLIFGWAGVDP